MSDYEDLMAGDRRVRSIRVRDVPWGKTPIADSVGAWVDNRDSLDEWLRQHVGMRDADTPFLIDEVSVFFDQFDEDKMWEYIRDAVSEPEVKMFNHSWDSVRTDPIPGEYEVEYCFLEVRDLGMRVEVMRIDRGDSPLHHSLGSFGMPVQMPHPIHYSFKVDDLEDYDKVCRGLKDGGAVFVQGCSSTYGAFSYWRLEDELGLQTFLKPRVNLRDIETPVEGVDVTGVKEYEEVAQSGGEGHPTIGRSIRDLFRKAGER